MACSGKTGIGDERNEVDPTVRNHGSSDSSEKEVPNNEENVLDELIADNSEEDSDLATMMEQLKQLDSASSTPSPVDAANGVSSEEYAIAHCAGYVASKMRDRDLGAPGTVQQLRPRGLNGTKRSTLHASLECWWANASNRKLVGTVQGYGSRIPCFPLSGTGQTVQGTQSNHQTDRCSLSSASGPEPTCYHTVRTTADL